jgi:hypothetical protein
MLKTLLCCYYYYVVGILKSCMSCKFICIKSELCSHHVGLDWQKLKVEGLSLDASLNRQILSWEFYSEWYHMHDESSLIRVAFLLVCCMGI